MAQTELFQDAYGSPQYAYTAGQSAKVNSPSSKRIVSSCIVISFQNDFKLYQPTLFYFICSLDGSMLSYIAMHIVPIQALRLFWQKHPDAERPLRAWYALAEKSQWRSPAEIKATLGNVSFVGADRVIFNIKGNDYRLIVVAEYQKGRLFIRFVGTHAEYDRIDPATI